MKPFTQFLKHSPDNIRSASKSIISALVGIALREHHIPSIDVKVSEYFATYFQKHPDPKKAQITLRHLLMMAGGLDSTDEENWDRWQASTDRSEFQLSLPLRYSPGEKFLYSTGYTNLVAIILAKATHLPTHEYANQVLFQPLGITSARWQQDPQGNDVSGISLSARDLAKFGQLYLQNGQWNGQQIVPADWVRESTSRLIQGSPGNGGYGYYWWTQPDHAPPFYYAWGYGGQYLYVVPSLDLVAVLTMRPQHRRPQEEIRRIFEQDIIPAASARP